MMSLTTLLYLLSGFLCHPFATFFVTEHTLFSYVPAKKLLLVVQYFVFFFVKKQLQPTHREFQSWHIPSRKLHPLQPEMEDCDCSNDKLPDNSKLAWNLLCYLDADKSMGPNRIHTRVLRELDNVIMRILSIIFQQSWEYGEVPVDWTLANIFPVFKISKKDNPGNYRSVSLTLVPGKIIQKIILELLKNT